MDMLGVVIVRDDEGWPIEVRIDLRLHHEMWENFYDGYVAQSRRGEPSEDWEVMKRHLGLRRKET